MRLDGRRILVTGGGRGLGVTIARTLAGRGARVVVTGRDPVALAAVVEECGAEMLVADLADAGAVGRLLDELGDVDGAVLNAGVPAVGTLDAIGPRGIDTALTVNLRSPMVIAQRVLPAMLARREGHLVFVGSLHGKLAGPAASVYCATKFGLRGFAGALHEDLHGTGVGVTTVMPGFVNAEGMFHDSGVRPPFGISPKRPQDVADAVASGIENGRFEVVPAPRALRVVSALGSVTPRVAGGLTRRLGGRRVAIEVARAHRDTW
jgi:short-subunit dehydrogenase